jgi:hypothetical protein
MVALPIAANLVLAAILLLPAAPVGAPVPSGAPIDPVPVGPGPSHGAALPIASTRQLIERVQSATRQTYACQGPWTVAGGNLKWACRTTQTLAVIEAATSGELLMVDVTWFGFDPRRSDLPTWGAAVHGDALADGDATAVWISDHLGTETEGAIGPVSLRVGGSRGALTLRLWA